MRASDEDRERAVGKLREHHSAGRLDTEELEERTSRALAARTLDELEALFTDLPDQLSVTRRRRPSRAALAYWTPFIWVNAMLIGIWALSGFGYFWPAWVLLGWGVPMAMGHRMGRTCGKHRRRSQLRSAA